LTPGEFTAAADLQDFQAALASNPLLNADPHHALNLYRQYRAELESRRRPIPDPLEPFEEPDPKVPPDPPVAPLPVPLPDSIPAEFHLYLKGAHAWHDGRIEDARLAWNELLALPAKLRPHKSTWASYMLGRSWHDADPGEATHFYHLTRLLARQGFADRAGLAVASLGWDGQLSLRVDDPPRALRFYLQQFAAGDTNAALRSLRIAARRAAFAPDPVRFDLASDPLLRRVITAWFLAHVLWDHHLPGEPDSIALQSTQWASTLENLGVTDEPLAEQLAVLAYQTGDWFTARHWANVAGDAPAAQWILSRLLLRDGDLTGAGRILAKLVTTFPVHDNPHSSPNAPPAPTPNRPQTTLLDSLESSTDDVGLDVPTPARAWILGEWGILHLHRGDFARALDALLRAGFWQDAAYVAERVLTVEELQLYVDRHWPPPPPSLEPPPEELPLYHSTSDLGSRLRYLLGRRLARLQQPQAALPYFPQPWRDILTQHLHWLDQTDNPDLTPQDRARARFELARLTRLHGLETLGTELAPDYAIWHGQFEVGPSPETRWASLDSLLPASLSELTRAYRHSAVPELRFHYRYTAAFLAWEAACNLPDHHPEPAGMLDSAGRWLKDRDPQTADLFYKALVNRHRRTNLGATADRHRWFPPLTNPSRPDDIDAEADFDAELDPDTAAPPDITITPP
jgi:tetratricopeptide (TPR) repeat protein